MILDLKKYSIATDEALNLCGYEKHVGERGEKGFIRTDGTQGRWHAQKESEKGGSPHKILIHYDLLVEWRHVVFHTPRKSKTEKQRITRILKRHKKTSHKKVPYKLKFEDVVRRKV